MASYDTTHTGIRILDLITSQESVIPRVLSGAGDWGPDGSQILFIDLVPAENEPHVIVYLVDLQTEIIELAFKDSASATDFSQPRWSPAGDWAAVALRPVNTGASKALWILALNGDERILIADDPFATFSAYSCDPWGDHLVYQRLELGSSDLNPSIWVWDWETADSQMLIEGGLRPAWLL